MSPRFTQAAALALGLVLAGCTSEAPLPTEAATVRLDVISDVPHTGAHFATSLTQEVTTTPAWAGDPDGTGEAMLAINPGLGEMCWTLSVAGILLPATSAHVHEAMAGVRGPVVVALSAPGTAGTAAGCATGVDRALLVAILANPASYYVNVHTADYPAGAVRGQLGR